MDDRFFFLSRTPKIISIESIDITCVYCIYKTTKKTIDELKNERKLPDIFARNCKQLQSNWTINLTQSINFDSVSLGIYSVKQINVRIYN